MAAVKRNLAEILLINARIIKRRSPPLTLSATVAISRALVKLSAIGDRKKVITLEAQKRERKPRPFLKSQLLKEAKTCLSYRALM